MALPPSPPTNPIQGTTCKGPDYKKAKKDDGNDNASQLDSSQLLMVDVLMTQMSKLMHDTLAENNAHTQRQLSHMSNQLHAVATTADSNISSLHTAQAEMKHELENIKQSITTQSRLTSPQRSTKARPDDDSDSDEERTRQVIIHGFAADTDEATITTFINNMLSTHALSKYADKVSTFSDPSSIGVILFKTLAGKAGFFKKMRDVNVPSPHNNVKSMSWTDNNTWDERVMNKQLGLFKHHLHTKHNIPFSDIRIRRSKRTVQVRGTTVVKHENDGRLTTTNLAVAVENDVATALETWKQKLTRE